MIYSIYHQHQHAETKLKKVIINNHFTIYNDLHVGKINSWLNKYTQKCSKQEKKAYAQA